MKRYTTYFKGEDKAMFDAMWQYVKDHCDVTPDGIYFVKFHVTDKKQFEEKIRSRMNGYYRDRISEQMATEKRQAHLEKQTISKQEMDKRIREVAELNRNRKITLVEKIKRFFA